VKGFPILSGHHLNCVPGTAVEKRTIWTFAYALLAANAKIGINFNAAKRRVILVGYPEHARFDGAIFNARGGARAASATIGRNRQDARLLFASGLAIALRHRPVFFYNVVQSRSHLLLRKLEIQFDSNIALPISSTNCVVGRSYLPR
jgi:hypothetical protein